MTNNILFKIFIIVIILLTTGYFTYHYYYNNKPVITIYPDDSPAKIKPQQIETIKSFGIGSTIYENLTSKKTLIKDATFLPEPEKPINIESRKQIKEKIEDLIIDFSSLDQKMARLDKISDLISLNDMSSDISDSPKIEENKTGLNIIKVSRDDEKVKKAQNYDEVGGYKVQLASVKSEAEAIAEGERIKKKFIKILKNADITTKKVKYDDGKFFYLVLAGDYKSLAQAKAICKKLSYQQQSCVLK
ncbi:MULTISPECIES: SPOR domain-containing protein [unclassified Rickettsia]|uniref:SPOR domain-containing protein n=1 Tax=unclassified Rickettsia TaxID=114295 RepID=UPI0020A17179|nr:SPOR domain-containing protein [Rickettsia endosymbiont of Ceutorhynchus assimilis]